MVRGYVSIFCFGKGKGGENGFKCLYKRKKNIL